MNWRWRALAQKIDPAMLAILSRNIFPQQMCRSWTRTIIDTLATTANMSKTITRLMSVETVCCLAGIPDIGLRMQTLRITEFFLLINSSNCISGRTTLARLWALKHKSLPKWSRYCNNSLIRIPRSTTEKRTDLWHCLTYYRER